MNSGGPDRYQWGSDIDDGEIEGETVTVRVDVDPLLLDELTALFGEHLSNQTLCRHAVATLIGYPSYAACSRIEHYVPDEEHPLDAT